MVRAVRDGGVVELLVDLVRLCVQLARHGHHGGTPDPDPAGSADISDPATLPRPPLTRLPRSPFRCCCPARPCSPARLSSGSSSAGRWRWCRVPGGLASFLRREQLGARLAGPSLPLDVGYSDDVPAAIRNAVRLRDQHFQWAGGYFL